MASSNPLIRERDVDFLLDDVLDVTSLTRLPAFAEHDQETFGMFVASARRLAREELFPAYRIMDLEPRASRAAPCASTRGCMRSTPGWWSSAPRPRRGRPRSAASSCKTFISGGDHDLTENIVHMTLARIDGAPPGTRGVSLFCVPKRRPAASGGSSALVDNDVSTAGMIHKIGWKGLPGCVLSFGERGDPDAAPAWAC